MHLTWGYDLVSQVQPGDRVLHWQTRAPPSSGPFAMQFMIEIRKIGIWPGPSHVCNEALQR